MKTILVTGGTGTLGRQLVPLLVKTGSKVRVLSRKERATENNVEYVTGDLATGEGVDAAVKGVDVIVHCGGSSKGDEVKTRHLTEAALQAGRPRRRGRPAKLRLFQVEAFVRGSCNRFRSALDHPPGYPVPRPDSGSHERFSQTAGNAGPVRVQLPAHRFRRSRCPDGRTSPGRTGGPGGGHWRTPGFELQRNGPGVPPRYRQTPVGDAPPAVRQKRSNRQSRVGPGSRPRLRTPHLGRVPGRAVRSTSKGQHFVLRVAVIYQLQKPTIYRKSPVLLHKGRAF